MLERFDMWLAGKLSGKFTEEKNDWTEWRDKVTLKAFEEHQRELDGYTKEKMDKVCNYASFKECPPPNAMCDQVYFYKKHTIKEYYGGKSFRVLAPTERDRLIDMFVEFSRIGDAYNYIDILSEE